MMIKNVLDEVHPYMKGATLVIRTHVLPEPFGWVQRNDYGHDGERKYNNNNGEFGCNPETRPERVDFVLANPPISGKTGLETSEFTVSKVIIGPKPLRFNSNSDDGGDDEYEYLDEPDDDPYNGPIIVTGRVQLPGQEEDGLSDCIAKIFDGAYYPSNSENDFMDSPSPAGPPPDCATRADMDYAAESKAYNLITEATKEQPELCKATPQFFGSWTIDLPCSKAESGYRPVRMILLEKLGHVQPMSRFIREAKQEAGPPLPAEPERLNTFKRLIEADNELWWWCDIHHRRIRPHDVLVRQDGTVAIINFQQAILESYVVNCSVILDKILNRRSPILRHWPLDIGKAGESWKAVDTDADASGGSWAEWVPAAWLDNPNLAALWLLQTFSGDERYDPLPQHWLDSGEHNKASKEVLDALVSCGRDYEKAQQEEERPSKRRKLVQSSRETLGMV
ncbi:hypothetical protein QBC40DRAFT_267390 [Triangularia verruculosa]|uniref:Uncharacterized protein n=1 Tax=Triangularia verruculosa TaxID=2587418 RepID=A0AAN6XDU1_9PEZI|nr:hypothetical protein QBC40DRAFT_267390 [Triangularia verruculosa]